MTMRNETEWVETTDANANILVGADSRLVVQSVANLESGEWQPNFDGRPYGHGNSAEAIVDSLVTNLG